MTDGATINNRVEHKNNYDKMAMSHGCFIVISCSVRDLNPIGFVDDCNTLWITMTHCG